MQLHEYLTHRGRFTPAMISLVVVAESPPVSGKYFYDISGATTESLFAAIMRHFGIQPSTKLEGLEAFRDRGWILVDATYEPVNANAKRDDVITRDYPVLRDDLKKLLRDRWQTVPLVLLKANVCDLLEPRLIADGFNVLNKGLRIYFPSHGRQHDFARQFAEVVA